MPPYDLIGTQNFLFMLAVGTGIAILVVLARGVGHYSFTLRPRSDAQLAAEEHEFGGGVTERNAPVPLLFWLLIPGVLTWAVGYVLSGGRLGL
jgi:hypothetical protein